MTGAPSENLTGPSQTAWAQRLPTDDGGPGGSAESGGSFRLAVKATVAVAGAALSAGCPVFADVIADTDATVVAALRPPRVRNPAAARVFGGAGRPLHPSARPRGPVRSNGCRPRPPFVRRWAHVVR